MKTLSIAALALFLLSTAAVSGAPAQNGTTQTPKQVVLAFYRLALMDFKPKEAFAQYAAPDFVEHSADSAGGTAQSTVDFLTGLIKKSPQPQWEIVRAVAEDDMVFLHVRFTPATGATPIVIGEIFRVRNGKIAEHWDIIQHAPKHPVNPIPVF
jgi:predicted SnoaL-like aldol condensation-catalyzing enzyme